MTVTITDPTGGYSGRVTSGLVTRYPSVMTLLTPLVHTERSTGVDAKLRRIEYLIGGDRIAVPVLSGNSIRGLIRRAAAQSFLEGIGAPRESLGVEAFDLLFTGGALEKGGSTGLDTRVSDIKALRRAIPPVGLLGGSAVSTILAGVVDIHMAIPIVKELEPWTGVTSDVSVWDITQEVAYTRRDDRDDREEKSRTQMRVTVEAISPGTRLQHGAVLRTTDPVLTGCFWDAVHRVTETRAMGGKGAVGHGLFTWTWQAPDDGCIDAYREHLTKIRDEAWSVLGLDQLAV